jgi:hypothetical protein
MNQQNSKIFLSYAREDMSMAKQLYNDLRRYGLDVWLDTESLLPGDRWKDKIQDAIENSNYFISLLSTRSVNKKGFVQKELKTALEVLDLFPSSQRFILPIRLDDCQIGERKLKEHHWVDLFPEYEYQNGLKRILKVVIPGVFLLRNKPKEFYLNDYIEMIRIHGFFDYGRNPNGTGLMHKYELREINGDKVVFDEATGLMWQQSGSSKQMIFEDAKNWIRELNQNRFAGFNDWRLPTLEEAVSLMEPEEKSNELFIDPIFDSKQDWILTADQVDSQNVWVVELGEGLCNTYPLEKTPFVRAVRSGKSSVD